MYNIKKKKDGSGYDVRLSLGQDIMTGKRIQKYLSAKTKTLLIEKIKRVLLQVEHNELNIQSPIVPFEKVAFDYLKYREELFRSGYLSVSTIREDERKITKDIIPYFKKADIKKINRKHILDFRDTFIESNSNLANKTINKKILALKQILDFATEKSLIHSSPYQQIKPLTEIEKEKEIWTAEEFQQFITYVREHEEPIFNAFFTLAFVTGARLSELLAFEKRFLESKLWEIKNTFVYDKKLKTFVFKPKPKKRSSLRFVPLDAFVLQQFENIEFPHDTFIFALNGVSPNGSHFTKKFERIIEKIGMKKITFHGLRHSNVSHLIGLGISTALIAQRVGHSSSSFTERVYGHQLHDSQQQVSDILHASLSK